MPTKSYNPLTPTLRYKQTSDFAEVTTDEAHKPLVKGGKNKAGRNNHGRITVRRRGGGHKRKYRFVDFKRDRMDVSAVVESIQYDPNRSAHIALIRYIDGQRRYIIAPEGVAVGDKLKEEKKLL